MYSVSITTISILHSNNQKNTPLHLACGSGNYAAAKALIKTNKHLMSDDDIHTAVNAKYVCFYQPGIHKACTQLILGLLFVSHVYLFLFFVYSSALIMCAKYGLDHRKWNLTDMNAHGKIMSPRAINTSKSEGFPQGHSRQLDPKCCGLNDLDHDSTLAETSRSLV